jgi:hypothetical protein
MPQAEFLRFWRNAKKRHKQSFLLLAKCGILPEVGKVGINAKNRIFSNMHISDVIFRQNPFLDRKKSIKNHVLKPCSNNCNIIWLNTWRLSTIFRFFFNNILTTKRSTFKETRIFKSWRILLFHSTSLKISSRIF